MNEDIEIQFENATCVQTDDSTITITAPDLSGGVWKSNKEVVTQLYYNSKTKELTVVKEYIEIS